ncbi:MAG TPA: DUF2169 domain-containing protein [Gemmatimonadales bacterium]
MQLVNGTSMKAEYTLGLDPEGRERVIVVIKGTFAIPWDGSQPSLAGEQVPLVMADEFTGEPGKSATKYESEFAPYKPRCDVLLNGSAYAPHGTRVTRVDVALRVATMAKSLSVHGQRVWQEAITIGPSEPEPFTRMPISYDGAFGGVDVAVHDPSQVRAFMKNPVGVGYYPLTSGADLVGRPLPTTSTIGDPVSSASGDYPPMSFGAIGRQFESRVPLAGTYDQRWLDNTFPFLPSDFNPLYYQSAPPDQQIAYPVGGERVELFNLTPQGYTQFPLPRIEMPVEFTDVRGTRTDCQAVLDTILIEPDLARFMLIWRTSLPLRRNLLELRQAVVGRMSPGYYYARSVGKKYFKSIQTFVLARRGEVE